MSQNLKPRQYAHRAREIKRAVILTRVSSDSQSENTSHETQQRTCEEFCTRRGWEVVARFEEVESGALYLSRLETQAAIELIERHEADVLVLYDMTRYGRDVEYQHKILKRIVKAGAQLQFASFPLEYDRSGELTPESEQMFNLLGGTSSAERKYIKRRLMGGKARKVEACIQISRTMPPHGWKIVDKKAVIRGEHPPEDEGFYFPIPETLGRIKSLMFEPYAAGASLGAIADRLRTEGFATPRGGKLWRPCGVRYILQNPVYMGRPAYGRNQNLVDDERKNQGMDKNFVRPRELADWKFLDTPKVKAHFARPDIAPYLVPEAMWWECQTRLSTNRAQRSERHDRVYPLSGLMVCHLCGRRLAGRVSRSNGRYKLRSGKEVQGKVSETRQYLCMDKVRFSSKVEERCSAPLWNAPLLEELIYEALARLLSDPKIKTRAESELAARRRSQAPEDDGAALQKQLDLLERRERVVAESKVEARMNGTSTAPFDAMLVQIAAEKASLTQNLSRLSSSREVSSLELPTVEGAEAIGETLINPLVENVVKNSLLHQIIGQTKPLPGPADQRYASRAAGAEITLRTGGELRAVLTIRQLKTRRMVKLDLG